MNEIGSISTLSFCFVWQSQWRYSELIKNSFEMEDVCRLIHICRKYRTHEFNATRPIFFLLWNNWTGNKKKSQNESEVGEVNKCIFFILNRVRRQCQNPFVCVFEGILAYAIRFAYNKLNANSTFREPQKNIKLF